MAGFRFWEIIVGGGSFLVVHVYFALSLCRNVIDIWNSRHDVEFLFSERREGGDVITNINNEPGQGTVLILRRSKIDANAARWPALFWKSSWLNVMCEYKLKGKCDEER